MELSYFFENNLHRIGVLKHHSVLIALSGGIDSMVMTHLFHQMGIKPVIAHCNFKLRGPESDADEKFVMKISEALNIPAFSKELNASEYATEKGISIQMAARKLRYDWFKEMAAMHQCNWIATGHHSGDNAETLLLNLVRGTGPAGMQGIRISSGNIIRPLLGTTRSQILEYATTKGIEWREDSSNLSDKYARNIVRKSVMPALTRINPSAEDAINHYAAVSERMHILNEFLINEVKSKLISNKGVFTIIDRESLMHYPESATLLFLFTRQLGFLYNQCSAILAASESGAEFISDEYRMILDRNSIVIYRPDQMNDDECVQVGPNESIIKLSSGEFQLELLDSVNYEELKKTNDFASSNTAYLDADKATYPITIRRAKKGDAFHPLGMLGSKLISDFFTDNKTSFSDRSCSYLITSNNEALWLAPHRIDERFKVNEYSKSVLRIQFNCNLNHIKP